jgi:conjugal transfer pilus assembly protein TraW
MKKKLLVAHILFFSVVQFTSASDLGLYGETYPIKEEDAIDAMKNEAKRLGDEGVWEKLNLRLKQRVKNYVARPDPVKGLTPATQSRTFYYDPSVTLETDIYDAEGNRLYRKGDTANPLHYVNLSRALVFFNADNRQEMNWALEMYSQEKIKPKMIMVAGEVEKTYKLVGGRVFFDQHGKLVNKFGILHTPAIVTQEGDLLRIDEIKTH